MASWPAPVDGFTVHPDQLVNDGKRSRRHIRLFRDHAQIGCYRAFQEATERLS
jgi:hypothetical protein